jgi:uncharacterized damage-inducible protein DinB
MQTILDYAADREGYHAPLHAAIDGLTAAQAAWLPPDGGHTIRQLAEHLRFWKRKVVRSLAGEPWTPTGDNDATFGLPGDPKDDAGWAALVEDLRAAHADLRQAVGGAELDGPEEPTLRTILIWVATHDSYHTGQIVQLRKRQGSWPR